VIFFLKQAGFQYWKQCNYQIVFVNSLTLLFLLNKLLYERYSVKRNYILAAIYFSCFVLTMPTLVWADALIPYLVVPLGEVLLFPLVVIIETLFVWILLEMPFWGALWRTFIANLASTAFGAILYFISMPLIGNPLWDVWTKYKTAAAILISLSFAIILCIISWLIESVVVASLMRDTEKRRIYITYLKANICSYALLWLLSLASLFSTSY